MYELGGLVQHLPEETYFWVTVCTECCQELNDLPHLDEEPLVYDITFVLDLVALSELPDNVVQKMLPIITTSDGSCCTRRVKVKRQQKTFTKTFHKEFMKSNHTNYGFPGSG